MSFGVDIPFVTNLGFDLQLFEGGHSEIHYAPRPEHLNSFGVTHGGACMTLLDVVMAVAARSVAKDFGVVTIEMKTSFMAFTEGTIFDADGLACAHATGTFKYVKRATPTADARQPPISTD
jgi:acyl-coenzyme A thioesterase PaaI-like protein